MNGIVRKEYDVPELNTHHDDALVRAAAVVTTRYGEFLDSTSDGIVIVDAQGRIVFANRQAETLFGYDRAELNGQPIEILLPARYRHSHTGHRASFFSQPRMRSMGMGMELFGVRKDNTEFPVDISLSPLKAKDGVLVSSMQTEEGMLVSAAIRDITDKRNAEQLIKERSKELESANNELAAFSYSVSHDLRAPLRAINGFCRIILDEYTHGLPDELMRYLRLIASNSSHMGVLVDDLLKFSQMSRQPLQRRTIAMNALVQTVLDELMTEEDRTVFTVDLHELPNCKGDFVLLKQVWTNLLSNAIKFTRGTAAPALTIGSGKEDGQTMYYVKDTGAGFDMAYAHKLFMVFQRLHRAEDFEGTGIGLALVQRIVHRHGGTIRAESVPAQGSTFFFTVGVANENE